MATCTSLLDTCMIVCIRMFLCAHRGLKGRGRGQALQEGPRRGGGGGEEESVT